MREKRNQRVQWGVSLIILMSTIGVDIRAYAYSISGISSGGFMAAQMGMIYSSQFSHVGVVAGGFYGCARNHFQEALAAAEKKYLGLSVFYSAGVNPVSVITGDLKNSVQLVPTNPLYQALGICMKSPNQAIPEIDRIQSYEKMGLIDPLANLKTQKYVLYNGKKDSVVQFSMQDVHRQFLEDIGVEKKNILLLDSRGGHNYPTDKKGLNKCSAQSIPYISSCEMDLAGEILKEALGNPNLVKNSQNSLENHLPRRPRREMTRDSESFKNLMKVSQFVDGSHPMSVADYGYLASSPYCLEQPENCHLHVALHGCEMSDSFDKNFDEQYQKAAQRRYLQMRNKQGADMVPWLNLPYIEQSVPQMGLEKFAKLAGYLDYVNDENRLMVLFPQTWIGIDNYPGNPKGCWDWYGYTGSEYLTKQGRESSWLMRLIQQVTKNPRGQIVK